ncbi:hypothetical protein J7J26_03990 [Candidatus Micrarchaeota archaeon]|nr:hypothetical protein [Candidatus Micrarchaeota archaeon]
MVLILGNIKNKEVNELENESEDMLLKASHDPEYIRLMKEMKHRDIDRINNMVNKLSSIDYNPFMYSSEPIDQITYDRLWLEPRVGYYTPIRYYQDIYINNEKQSMFWRHDCMRGIYHDKISDLLYLLTKHTTENEESFLSFVFIVFKKGEFEINEKNGVIGINSDVDKSVMNVLTGKSECIHVSFNFIHHPIRYTSPIHARSTALYRNAYTGGRTGHVQAKSNMSKYIIPSSHFTVHPYILNLHKKYGFKEPEDMEKKVNDYIQLI